MRKGFYLSTIVKEDEPLTVGKTLRLFVACDIPELVKDEIDRFAGFLKKHGVDVKWTRKENLHLTLKFFGNISSERVEEIKKSLTSLKTGIKPFSVHFSGVGAFPDIHKPSIIWIGVDKGESALKVLAETIDAGFSRTGFEKEKRDYSAHLTLGRVKDPRYSAKLTRALKSASFSSVEAIPIEHITLYKSVLTSEGPVYEAIERFEFVY